VAHRGGQPRAKPVDLVVEALLRDLALSEQAAAVTNGRAQRVLLVHGDRPAVALPSEVGQRRAVPVVGLEPARPELIAGSDCLRRREQPHCIGEALRQLASPHRVQRTGRLDRDDRRLATGVLLNELGELLQTRPQHRQRLRLDQQTRRVRAQPDPNRHLARVDRHDQTVDRQRPLKQIPHDSLQPADPRSDKPWTRGLDGYQLTKASQSAVDSGRNQPSTQRPSSKRQAFMCVWSR
jgi:hypothetical protein